MLGAGSTHDSLSVPGYLESLRVETNGGVPGQDTGRCIEAHWCVAAARDGRGKDDIREKFSSVRWAQ